MNWKKRALTAMWTVVALGWLAFIVLYLTGPSKTVLTIGFAAALIVSELAVYATAALLGMSVIESRKTIWAKLTSPFRKQVEG